MLPHWYFSSWSPASSPKRATLRTRRCLRRSNSCEVIGKTLRTLGSTWWGRASRLDSRRSYLLFRTFERTFPCSECRQLHQDDFFMPHHAPLMRIFGQLDLLQTYRWSFLRFLSTSSAKDENHLKRNISK